MLMFLEEVASGFFSNFNWVDYVIAGVILLGMIIGAKKGFIDQLFGILGTFGAIVGAILLCKTVGGLMSTDGAIFDKVSSLLSEKFGEDPIYTTAYDWSNTANVNQALSTLGIPAFLSGLFTNIFASFSPGGTPAVLSEVLPLEATKLVNYAIAFIVLLIVLAVIISILKKILTNIVKIPGISTLDKFLGFVLGAAFSALILVAICLGLSALTGIITPIGNFLDNTVYSSYIGKYLEQLVTYISSLIGGFLN